MSLWGKPFNYRWMTTIEFVMLVFFAACQAKREDVPFDAGTADSITHTSDVIISNSEVRSCHLILLEGDEISFESLRFDAATDGQFEYRAPYLTVSFFNDADAPFEGVPFEIVSRDADGNALEMTLVSARCFDRLGRALDEPGIEVRWD